MLFFMILIGIQLWISKLKIDAIELDRQEMSQFIDSSPNTVLKKTFS